MYKGLTISVVIPCFNEEKGIAAVLRNMPAYVDEVVVVDNNSTDGTAAIASQLGARVIFESKKGYGNAYQAGLPEAKGDIIATVDGDGTYPSSAIGPIVDFLIERKLDFISASRFPLQNPKAMRRRNWVGNMILTWTTRVLWLRYIRDSQSGMWVFRRRVLDHIHPVSPGMSFSEEIKIETLSASQLKFGEYHVRYEERIGDTKLFPFQDGVDNVRWLFRRRFLGRVRTARYTAEPSRSAEQ